MLAIQSVMFNTWDWF